MLDVLSKILFQLSIPLTTWNVSFQTTSIIHDILHGVRLVPPCSYNNTVH